ncbi:MAG: carboxypeptidase regulatory-like domain-containing protein [Candidatus Atribacteria bacterium]|nr:carboxypeptidase regulatory-like domain-containing protein [Candidatus Atribacteria bacterium]
MKRDLFLQTRFIYLGISVFLLVFMFFLPQAYSYSPPSFNDNHTQVENPGGHGTIILKAIDILRNDGYGAMANQFNQYLLQLYEGAYQADQGGSFSYLGVTLGRNYFSHFYEASTGKGFYLTSDYSNAEGISFDWKVSTLRGPHAAATDMCNWYYAQAAGAMRDNNPTMAMKYLGYALHVLSDLAVPHHATNIGAHQDRLGEELTVNADASEKTTHGVYENAVDTALNEGAIAHVTYGGIYHADWNPSDYCVYTAQQSAPYINDIKYQDSGPQYFRPVANIIIPLAERLCAGLMRRFYENWKNEMFTVVALKITRVKAIGSRCGKYLDCPDEADFYVKVKIGTRQFPTSGVIEGRDDADPNILSEYNWFYPIWYFSRNVNIPVEISLWDEDTVTSDDHADIDPGGGKDLDFTYNLVDGRVTGDVTAVASGRETQVFARGENSDGQDRAEIWITVTRDPVLPPGTGPNDIIITQTTSISGTIHDECNQPVAGATIHIPNTEYTSTAGSDGSFLLENVPLNTISGTTQFIPIILLAEKDGYQPQTQTVNLTANEVNNINFTLNATQPPSSSIRVMVTSGSGETIDNAEVTIVDTNTHVPMVYKGDYRLPNITMGCGSELSSNVTVNAEGYQSQSKPVILRPNQYNQVAFVLSPISTNDGNDHQGGEGTDGSNYFQEGNFVTLQSSSSIFEGSGPIYGWTWLRNNGDRASWTFQLDQQPINVKAAALNFSLLVTNQVNGGSGFTSNPKVKISDINGTQLGSSTLHLVNTFRPKYSENTVGIGYPASGSIEFTPIKQLVSQGKSFIVTIEWPAPDRNHLAVKKDSVILAYIISSETTGPSDQMDTDQRKDRK